MHYLYNLHYDDYSRDVFITENRAATDQSVKLLSEFEQKALDKVLKTVKLENNRFSAVLYEMKDYLSVTRQFLIRYSINAKEYSVQFSVDAYVQEFEIVNKAYKELSEDIATNVLKNLFK